jgi:peptidoglycan L-alanyl-D-glutamate endopeptidase CwlK
MASRRIEDLREIMQSRAKAWLAGCQSAGLDVLIYCTLRSLEEQAGLYAIGRTLPGKRVTNAPPGSSAHNFGLALDFVPLNGGKAQWKAPSDEWNEAVDIAGKCGLESGSTWPRLKDWPHLEFPRWKEIINGPLGG